MKKRILSALLAAAMLLGIPAMTGGASMEPSPHLDLDVDQDGWSGSVTDAIALQRYLLGQIPFTQTQFNRADVNMDGKVNAYDLTMLKYLCCWTDTSSRCANATIFKPTDQFFEIVHGGGELAVAIPEGTEGDFIDIFYTQAAYVTTEEELQHYLCGIMSEEERERLSWIGEGYINAPFFWVYDLAMLAIPISTASDTYAVEGAHFENGTLIVDYRYEPDPYGAIPNEPVAALLWVMIPKSMEHPSGMQWNEHTTEVQEITAQTAMTSLSYNEAFWERADSDASSAVITGTQELEEWLAPIVSEEEMATFRETYTDAYFAEHVLLLNAFAQTSGGQCAFEITGIAQDGSALTVTWRDLYEELGATEDIVSDVLAQVSIPSDSFTAETVTWIEE